MVAVAQFWDQSSSWSQAISQCGETTKNRFKPVATSLFMYILIQNHHYYEIPDRTQTKKIYSNGTMLVIITCGKHNTLPNKNKCIYHEKYKKQTSNVTTCHCVNLHMAKGNTSTGKAEATACTKGPPKKAAPKKAPTKKAPTKNKTSQKWAAVDESAEDCSEEESDCRPQKKGRGHQMMLVMLRSRWQLRNPRKPCGTVGMIHQMTLR